MLTDRKLHKAILMFGAAGAVGTAAHYVTLVALVELAVAGPVAATSVGFLVGALVNYFLNHRFTFRSAKRHLDAGPKFLAVAVATALLNAWMVHVGVGVLALHYMLAQVAATLIVFITNFALNAAWTFRQPN